ncbi:hypothetical protein G7Y89_g2869 [Cudoniella acicularis]|uniref:Major facilitator superfamily (MFS) profile domain-containing protein n=1 Tax=Cudoniella acicularis TaxID=354080 RepID=A0A8H4W6J1_9HELO|nr:hypothetical protein G7Y89_g2869 [Cudoniella acicularis]
MDGQAPASWRNLPRKNQLALLALCRVVDFFQLASFQTICYYQLKSFSPSALATPTEEQRLSWQTGVASASFTATQSCTAILWGYIADTKWVGRKNVLLVGLVGTCLSCIGVAFSTSFVSVVIFRACGGMLNGTVGIVHQSRAFLLLPASFSVASIIGPVSAGWLSDPAKTYPTKFGGVDWLRTYPYSLPSLLSALLLILMSIAVLFNLNETLDGFSPTIHLTKNIGKLFSGTPVTGQEACIQDHAPLLKDEIEMNTIDSSSLDPNEFKARLPFRKIWTRNVVLTLVTVAVFEFHLGAFGSMWPLLLSSPKEASSQKDEISPIFRGGLGMGPRNLGYATAFMGMAGLALQLLLYPTVHSKLGTLKCYRVFSLLFPAAYALAPFLVVISGSLSIASAAEAVTWVCILVLLSIHITGRIFCIPVSITLLNNCAPHPSVLGIVHGIGQSTSATFRTMGPICAGYLYGIGHVKGMIGISWWTISATALVAWLASLLIREGSGYEIILPGDICKEDKETMV